MREPRKGDKVRFVSEPKAEGVVLNVDPAHALDGWIYNCEILSGPRKGLVEWWSINGIEIIGPLFPEDLDTAIRKWENYFNV